MGLLDDIVIYRSFEPEDVAKNISTLEVLKKYYDDLMDAKVRISTYIICYDRAISSVEFALRQYNFCQDELKNVADTSEDRIDVDRGINDTLDEANSFLSILKNKRDNLNSKSDKLDSYLETVIYLNNLCDAFSISQRVP